MPTVRCKFVCNHISENGEGENKTKDFYFSPVTGGSDENRQFWKWTPSGELKFQCLNPSVNFEKGKTYYLDITEAP
jgi:hypothetical protein